MNGTVMAIVQLSRITFYGAESQKGRVIDHLQELGCAHVINLEPSKRAVEALDTADESRQALRYLQSCPEQRRSVRRADQFDRELTVAEILEVRSKERDLRDERDQLTQAISQLEPWGEFQLPPHSQVGDVRLWFYVVSIRNVPQMAVCGCLWREVSRDHRQARILVLSVDEPRDVPGPRITLDQRPLSQLRGRLEDVQEELSERHHQRVGLTRWSDLLASALNAADDAAAQARVVLQTRNGRDVFALQAWVPDRDLVRVQQFADQHDLAVTIEPPAADDRPPTLLQNPESVAGSEALVTFYRIPDYRSWDPSVLAWASFAVFFAMIVADAGYGLILAWLAAWKWKSAGRSPAGRQARNVLAVVVGATVVYGVLCGSYFGVTPPADAALGRLQLIDAQSQDLMMPLTIIVGVIHLALANLLAAWQHCRRLTALAPLGWVLAMAGAVLVGMPRAIELEESLQQELAESGTVLLAAGLLAVFLFSSERPLFSFSLRNHGLRVFDGLKGLTGVSGLFGDVLSYLRLFALGLSSAKLSATFNQLGASAWDEAGFGVILAVAIVLLGHSLNLALSVVSGLVHGLRLNCIEFFKWGLPEEGYAFTAFAKKARRP